MTSADLDILKQLPRKDYIAPQDLEDDLTHIPDQYIKSRLDVLEKYGYCYDAGNGRYQSKLDPEDIEEKAPLIRELSVKTVRWDPKEDLEWVDHTDIDVLVKLRDLGSPHNIHNIDGLNGSLEESKVLSKLQHLGLVRRYNINEYKITEKGRKVLDYDIGPFELMYPILPYYIRPIHSLADRILTLLHYFDPTKENVVRNLDSSGWQSERIFHEVFEKKFPRYATISVLGVTLVLVHVLYSIPPNFQSVGLAFDIVGATFVALGLFRGKRGIAIESEEYGGRLAGAIPLQPESVRATTSNTLDGVFGTIFLVIGFIFQLISTL